jgi:hypothetical protein
MAFARTVGHILITRFRLWACKLLESDTSIPLMLVFEGWLLAANALFTEYR